MRMLRKPMRNSSSGTKKQGWLSYSFEYILFTEKFWVRCFRVLVTILILLVWGFFGAILEPERGDAILRSILRYAFVPLAAMIWAFLVGAVYLQDIYELPRYRSALRYLFACMFDGPPLFLIFGRSLPTLDISGGKANTKEGEINLLQRIGGPGWLSVEAGNVVLLEYLHGPAKAVGTGYHFVSRLQRVAEVFSLEDQHWIAKPIIATTKDGIEVAVHDFQFGYRFAVSPHGSPFSRKRTLADPYPFSAEAVFKFAYSRGAGTDGKLSELGQAVQSELDGKLKNFINRNSIDQIVAPIRGDPREAILERLSSAEVRGKVLENLGTEITWLNIGQFEVNDKKIEKDIKDYRLDAWFSQWAGKAALIRAQGKAEQISQTEGGRIEKTTSMLRGILQSLEDVDLAGKDDMHLWNIVLARTAQIIEAMTSLYDVEKIENGRTIEKGKP